MATARSNNGLRGTSQRRDEYQTAVDCGSVSHVPCNWLVFRRAHAAMENGWLTVGSEAVALDAAT